MDRTGRILCVVYAVVAIAALMSTWSQNLAFFGLPDNGGAAGFIRAAFVNSAAASIGFDLLFMSVAAFIWMVVEASRLGIRFVWLYVALSLLIAVSVMFPLFLIARQMQLARRA